MQKRLDGHFRPVDPLFVFAGRPLHIQTSTKPYSTVPQAIPAGVWLWCQKYQRWVNGSAQTTGIGYNHDHCFDIGDNRKVQMHVPGIIHGSNRSWILTKPDPAHFDYQLEHYTERTVATIRTNGQVATLGETPHYLAVHWTKDEMSTIVDLYEEATAEFFKSIRFSTVFVRVIPLAPTILLVLKPGSAYVMNLKTKDKTELYSGVNEEHLIFINSWNRVLFKLRDKMYEFAQESE